LGDIQGSLSIVHILLSHRPACGNLCRAFKAFVITFRLDYAGSRRFYVRPRLRDFFGTATIVKPGNDLPLRRSLGFGLSDLWLEPAGIKPSHELTFAHTIAFLD
jgi:hypothetical protein